MVEKNRIIFLDRDGVINELREDYVKNFSEFVLLPDVGKHLSKLSQNGFKLIIITNQSAIGRGFLSKENLEKIHRHLKNKLLEQSCVIDRIFYCPHIPEDNCTCRKPNTDLFERAVKEFHPVDMTNSWIIGDNHTDIQAAKKLELNSILVKSNSSIEGAVKQILTKYKQSKKSLKQNLK